MRRTREEANATHMDAISAAARALLLICAAAAAMDMVLKDERGALAFRSVCALAVAVGACRLAAGLFGLI